jgi:hypothetical protein
MWNIFREVTKRKKNVLQQEVGNECLHEVDNGVSSRRFWPSRGFVRSTTLSHGNIHKYTWVVLWWEGAPTDHVLIESIKHQSTRDIWSCEETECDSDQHVRERLAISQREIQTFDVKRFDLKCGGLKYRIRSKRQIISGGRIDAASTFVIRK